MRLILFLLACIAGISVQAQVLPVVPNAPGEEFQEAVVVEEEIPAGISKTTVTINPNAPEHIKAEFYKQSNGANSYQVYNNEKGHVVSEEEVTYQRQQAKYKEVSPLIAAPPK